MNTSTDDPISEIFRGHIHGLILYRASHQKPPWVSNNRIQQEHYAKHIPTGPVHPLKFALPRALPQIIGASYYDKPEPLLSLQAATRLFSPRQMAFASAADSAA